MISQDFQHLPKPQPNQHSYPKAALGEGWLFPDPKDDIAGHSKAAADIGRIEWDQNKYYKKKSLSCVI